MKGDLEKYTVTTFEMEVEARSMKEAAGKAFARLRQPLGEEPMIFAFRVWQRDESPTYVPLCWPPYIEDVDGEPRSW